jgi:hypothetical protein
MKYEDRISRRRRWGVVVGFLGLLMVAITVYVLMWFVVMVAVPLAQSQQGLLLAVVGVIAAFAYMGGWAARTFHTENIDTQIGTMGKTARNVVAAGIQEMNERER